jgi:serine/threonine-protein kinase
MAGADDEQPIFPERIGRYDVLLPIGRGGMATVYLARTKGVGGFEREVAIKQMHAHLRESAELGADLVEEAKLAGRIRHPNVVSVLDAGDNPDGVFLVMEYIEGDVLSALRRAAADQGGVPLPISLRILDDALRGLHAAHELAGENGAPLNLVHRDFSPQNLIVGTDGVTRLADFGIAKTTARIASTRTGLVKGKVGYMSPEQVRGQAIDRRSDVWAAGVVAWEIFSGQRLFPSGDELATLLRIVTEPPPRLRAVRPELPQAVDDVVAKALAQGVAERTPTADQLRRDLLAAWAPRAVPADRNEVADYVTQTVRDKLEQRREKIARVAELRMKISYLVPAPEDSSRDREAGKVAATAADTTATVPQVVPVSEANARQPLRGVVAAGAIALAAIVAGVVWRLAPSRSATGADVESPPAARAMPSRADPSASVAADPAPYSQATVPNAPALSSSTTRTSSTVATASRSPAMQKPSRPPTPPRTLAKNPYSGGN